MSVNTHHTYLWGRVWLPCLIGFPVYPSKFLVFLIYSCCDVFFMEIKLNEWMNTNRFLVVSSWHRHKKENLLEFPSIICRNTPPHTNACLDFEIKLWFSCTDVPSSPGQPEAELINKDSCKITWSPPASDNGAPVTGYTIERSESISGQWVQVSEENVSHDYKPVHSRLLT